jgi:hypothetical protein
MPIQKLDALSYALIAISILFWVIAIRYVYSWLWE